MFHIQRCTHTHTTSILKIEIKWSNNAGRGTDGQKTLIEGEKNFKTNGYTIKKRCYADKSDKGDMC